MHLLYLTAEQWPTFRPDVIALFGKYLPREGVTCDLVTERDLASADRPDVPWGAGRAILCRVPRNRAGHYLTKCWHNLRILAGIKAAEYDAIQVRDMSITALAGLLIARAKGIRFYYWLSFPQSEGQIERARSRGMKGGMRFWFPLMQGMFGKWLLYRIVLPRADHVFVQSRQMQSDVAREGIPERKMTPVPMGVDLETASPENIVRADDPRLHGKRVVAYLGTLDPQRRIEVLLKMLALIVPLLPDVRLLLVGDTEDAAHRAWLKAEVERLDIADYVIWTGWLPASEGWSYIRTAEIGLSPFPRGFLLDSASPTKAVEYMALGLPVIANDSPDQAQVIEESGAGLCVPLEPAAFAEAVVSLLESPETRERMGRRGRQYVAEKRGYDSLSRSVAAVYRRLEEAV